MLLYSFGLLEGLSVFILSIFFNQHKFNLKLIARQNSTFHALVTSSFAILYLNNIVPYTWTFVMGFSAGYALYELLLSPCISELKPDKATLVHHLIMAYSSTYYDQYPTILALCYLTEISTIFLNTAYIELKRNGKTRRFYTYSILTLSTFFIFRILMLWVVVWYMYISNNYLGTTIGSFMGLLNLFWFKKLINAL